MFLRRVARGIKIVSQLILDTPVSLRARPTQRGCVLIVRLDAIGDFVVWLDAATATVSHYRNQGKKVILVANSAWAEWSSELAIFDEVIGVERHRFNSSFRYRMHIAKRVRRLNAAVAIQPTYSRELLFGDAIIRISNATERIGSVGDDSNRRPWHRQIADRWYTKLIAANPALTMELVRNAEFVRGLGITSFQAKLPTISGTPDAQGDPAFIAELPADTPYFVLFPGASWDGRIWPVQRFGRIAERIHQQTGWHGVICGGPNDRPLAEAVMQGCTVPLLNWAGHSNLGQLTSILRSAQLLIANETSAIHIAAACGTPAFCLLGGGHYGRFMPYQIEQSDERPLPQPVIHAMPCFHCNWQCIYKRTANAPVPCIDQITVDEVWNAISIFFNWPLNC